MINRIKIVIMFAAVGAAAAFDAGTDHYAEDLKIYVTNNKSGPYPGP